MLSTQYGSSAKVISVNRKQDRNGALNMAMKNMAESRFHPVPKPRTKQKPFPASTTDLIVNSSNGSNASSSPPTKPPVIKPKPKGYKVLDFNNKGLVSITKDIDINEEPVTINSSNENMEKNNNVTSVKDSRVLGNVNVNSTTKSVGKPTNVAVTSSQSYNKPLPLPPSQNAEDSLEIHPNQNRLNVSDVFVSDLTTKAGENVGNQCSPLLPVKHRMHRSSESQLHEVQNTKLGTLSDSLSKSATDLSRDSNSTDTSGCNPPLKPRKPTKHQLKTHTPNSTTKPIDSTRHNDIIIGGSQPIRRKQANIPTLEIENVNARNSVSSLNVKNNRDKDIGRTPPLPRKPVQKLTPAQQRHLESRIVDRPINLEKTTSHVVSGSHNIQVGGNMRLPRPSRPSPTQLSAVKERILSASEDKLSCLIRSEQTTKHLDNSCSNNHLQDIAVNDKHGHPGSSPLNTMLQGPPQRSLPPLPPENSNTRNPPRRLPPTLPKQPSIERKKSPPAPPQAPRPKSVFPARHLETPPIIARAKSEGALANNEDDNYWVAYQHMTPIDPPKNNDEDGYEEIDTEIMKEFIASVNKKSSRPGHSKEKLDVTKSVLPVDSTDNIRYEAPGEEVMKGFMKSIAKKNEHQSQSHGQSKEQRNPRKQLKHTYSSSSDDSDHEYVEPDDSPVPDSKNNNQTEDLLSPCSSTGSHNYIEPIHSEDPTNSEKTLEHSKKKLELEFKPFQNMEGDWSEPKEIKWEYQGESGDDSDASYVEPDGDDASEIDSDEDQEEPLYQIYQANVLQKERTLSLKRHNNSRSSGPPISPGNVILRSATMRAGKMLWSQLPEVRNSGLLDNIVGEQRKIQEAIYEVISSEASYLKSLNLLVDHFLKYFSVDSFDPILDKKQFSELFSNILEIVKVSQRFLDDLRSRQRQSILIESISDIITEHATNKFNAYVTYCSCQYKQDRMLVQLRKNNYRFLEVLEKLERDSRVVGLTLQSFLVLPMQRVTRYPLLVDAIVRRCEPGCNEYYETDTALKAVYQVVHKCNEGARKEERREEMIQIGKTIAFLKVKSIQLVTKDRWLLRRGPLQLLEFDSKMSLSNTLRKLRKYNFKTIYLFVFNDLLVVTKKKSEMLYSVIDFANRSMIRIQNGKSNAKNSFLLVLLENFERKTKELNVRAVTETEMTRWKEAFHPPEAESDDEKIYGTWDCPQVHALHMYQGQQSDELSLVPGDVVNVTRKLADGWYEGERIRDGQCGWFPANHTEEIRNEHVRARNLHQRYRLLAASTAYLDKKKK